MVKTDAFVRFEKWLSVLAFVALHHGFAIRAKFNSTSNIEQTNVEQCYTTLTKRLGDH